MCERNGSGVSTLALPVPSRSSSTVMSVSRVFRATFAVRATAEPYHERAFLARGWCTLSIMQGGGPSDKQRTSDYRHRVAAPDATEDFLFHLYRGSELLQDNRVHEAKEELEQALKLQPRDAQGQDLLAVVYFHLGLFPPSIEIHQKLVSQFSPRAALNP